MYFLTFQPEYVARLCLHFNKSQPIYICIYDYKDYAYKKNCSPEKCSLDEKYLVRSEIKADLKVIGKWIARNTFLGYLTRISYDP